MKLYTDCIQKVSKDQKIYLDLKTFLSVTNSKIELKIGVYKLFAGF